MAPTRRDWTLDPGVVFLNHGSFGACPRPVLKVQAELRTEMEREPVAFFTRRLEGLLDAARQALAGLVHARPEDLVAVRNATEAAAAVAGSLELTAGDELLTTDHAYNACRNVLERAAARVGAEVTTARIPFPLGEARQVTDAVLAAVTPRTRLALLDHVTSPTALRLPVEELVPALRARGVETLVDGAHALGMLPLDLDRLGAGYYTANAHKWLCTPKGAAFLHVRADLAPRVFPPVVSHGMNIPRESRVRLHDLFDWRGTDDFTPFLCIPAAIDFLGRREGGIAAHMEANRTLARRARDLLAKRLGVAPPCPDSMLGSMAALPLPPDPVPQGSFDRTTFPAPSARLHSLLYQRYRIQVPVSYWPGPPARLVRVSAQAYNRLGDYRTLADALAALLAEER